MQSLKNVQNTKLSAKRMQQKLRTHEECKRKRSLKRSSFIFNISTLALSYILSIFSYISLLLKAVLPRSLVLELVAFFPKTRIRSHPGIPKRNRVSIFSYFTYEIEQRSSSSAAWAHLKWTSTWLQQRFYSFQLNYHALSQSLTNNKKKTLTNTQWFLKLNHVWSLSRRLAAPKIQCTTPQLVPQYIRRTPTSVVGTWRE